MNKNVLACSIGTLVEWSEFTFYAYLIYKFSHLFFPNLNPHLSLLAAFGTFAISYIARPLGGFIFGHLGDKRGRQKALSYSILLMGLVTFLIGILPTYTSIGISASICLIILRFIQGIAVAGEFTGAAVFLIEHNKHQKPYLSSSWISTSSASGMLLGSLAAVIVSLPNMPDWAWRVPFLLGAIACLIGFYIRYKLNETNEYKNISQALHVEKIPIKKIFTHHKISLLKTASIAAFVGIYIYICNIWWTTYAIEHHYFTSLEARILATIGQASVVLLTPFMGLLAEHWDGKKLMRMGFFFATLVAPLIFYFTSIRSICGVALSHIFYAFCNTAVTATMFKYLADIFPVNLRYTGQAVGWNVAVAIFGGTAPLLAQYFSSAGLTIIPICYVIISALVALATNYLFNFSFATPAAVSPPTPSKY